MLGDTETEDFWAEFFRSLRARGLTACGWSEGFRCEGSVAVEVRVDEVTDGLGEGVVNSGGHPPLHTGGVHPSV
jgi:hypothetical protein